MTELHKLYTEQGREVCKNAIHELETELLFADLDVKNAERKESIQSLNE